jgi:hypothetical protein
MTAHTGIHSTFAYVCVFMPHSKLISHHMEERDVLGECIYLNQDENRTHVDKQIEETKRKILAE